MVSYTPLDTAAAVEQLRAGHVIAYPTEAVFGLGCDPANEPAVRSLLMMKNRQESSGLVLIASRFSQLRRWIAAVDETLIERAMQTWPGPVTWLFPRADNVPDYVAGQHDKIAVRITAHGPSRALCEAFGGALISTSANHTTAEPARTASQVHKYFGSWLAGILNGELGDGEKPSEIRDLVSGNVIRRG